MAEKPRKQQPRLPLQTLFNARDLGGIPTADGQMTASGRFIRSDAPVNLNPDDLAFLLNYPVRTVIDLRSDDELNGSPHPLDNQPGIDFHHIPLLGDNLDTAMNAARVLGGKIKHDGLPGLYIYAIEHAKPRIGRVFSALANAGPGASLYHCTLGKDRAGLVSALLLLLAGASDDEIVDQYAVSSVFLEPMIRKFIDDIPKAERHFFGSDPENMQQTLAYFRSRYGSTDDYLASCGVSDDEIDALRQKMLC